jgi:hypothetical protein
MNTVEGDEQSAERGRLLALSMLRDQDPADIQPVLERLIEAMERTPNHLALNVVAMCVAALLQDCSPQLRGTLCVALGGLVSTHLEARANGAAFATMHPSVVDATRALDAMAPRGTA